ncbi:MAG: hypothetical protein INQ03_21940 [Candidatus Heimdallarchaeota archaeon]|nr:hypothetical protein [Candidatus Heimdallarchaeota archaeon]
MEVNKIEYIEFQRYKLISELSLLNDRISLFEKKYKMTLEEFENKVQKGKEELEKWDDLIEWKAYVASFQDVKIKLEKLKDV